MISPETSRSKSLNVLLKSITDSLERIKTFTESNNKLDNDDILSLEHVNRTLFNIDTDIITVDDCWECSEDAVLSFGRSLVEQQSFSGKLPLES